MDQEQKDIYESQIQRLSDRLDRKREEYAEMSDRCFDLEMRNEKLEELLTEANRRAAEAEARFHDDSMLFLERSKEQKDAEARTGGRKAFCSLFLGVLVAVVILCRGNTVELGTGFAAVGRFLLHFIASFVGAGIVWGLFTLLTHADIHRKESRLHIVILVIAFIIGVVVACAGVYFGAPD